MSVIKNLPALPMRSQINCLSDMLRSSIYNGSELKEDWEQADDFNSTRLEIALCMLLDHEVEVFGCGAQIWVYCTDLSDVEQMKKVLKAYGYKNLATFVPKVSHPENDELSIPDPLHPYAIRVNKSESLVFGERSKEWLELNKNDIDLVRDEIIYTYCYNTDARFTFASKLTATILYTALLKTNAELTKVAEARKTTAPQLSINLSRCRHSIDCWVVSLDLARN